MRVTRLCVVSVMICAACASQEETLPPAPEFPVIPAREAIGRLEMGDSDAFEEEKLDIPVTPGPFKPSWESIEANYPGPPEGRIDWQYQ